MIDLRPVMLIVGIFVMATAALMLIPMVADLLANHRDWRAFAGAALISGSVGAAMAASNWGRVDTITTRQGFLLTGASWLAIVTAAAIPLMLGVRGLSFTDAFFEAMSGLTTTGATVVTGLDTSPPGFLLWRSMLQWIGGVGIVIMAIAILPFLSVGGMQLFRLESSDPSEKLLPGASQIATWIIWIYVTFTATCFVIYWAMGMSGFDAINHAMTTIATGGFSTKDASFGYFLTPESNTGPVDVVATVFMLIGALPFGIYMLALRGNLSRSLSDSQTRFFLAAAFLFSLVIGLRIIVLFDFDIVTGFRLASFNAVSIMTGTGYASTDYSQWGPFAVGFFFCIMFVGGCAGSTSCGLKIFRLQVAVAALFLYIRRLTHPHRVTVARYNGRPLTDEVFLSVLSFFFIYFATFATSAVFLSLYGLDTVTALSAAGTAIANVGPGLGEIVGPAGNFSSLPIAVKWTLSLTMLLGRLELLTILVMLTPSFWSR
ncbi:Trk system potassium uptake protein TrkH [Parvularcula bermudensis HTCC2503]|uniref:Trk system potassium uptake protein n=1 Tax=Parvularcula bermudensis (strain ATCC BAA-594 / HTCC2503 / KCTC 12087) TaxID=314260 RepID=E0THQ6_PARBH|nr:TrkH family potassium uptake protein [Parvularcula bermudensis]ADM09352.1 Trk system potassium uptake protein TrkH [Parvularcula bermudensis HTCC2503]